MIEVSNSLGAGARLRYPLGYWNANGAICGIGVALLLWLNRHSTWTTLRWLAVAATPGVLLTLYFTFSRGGLLALVIATGCLLALSHDRLWMLATFAVGVLGALPAVLYVQAHESITNSWDNPATIDQGLAALAFLLAGTAAALALFTLLRRLESRPGQLTGKAVELSRNPTLLKRVALAGALVAIAIGVAIGGRAWDQFSSSDVQFPVGQPSQHFGQLSGAGRHDFWRVAIDAFGEKPLQGIGAGTYEFAWEQHRSIAMPVHDAHSLYLEAFAELGVLGGVLVLALLWTLLWTGFSARRHAAGAWRELYAALFAAMLAFAVGAALDWFWEIPALGAVFFLAAGVLVGVRCQQLAQAGEARDGERSYGFVAAGLATAWIAAIALVGPLLVAHELKASQHAAADGDIQAAINHANNARSIEPWAASPYVQLGLIAQYQREYAQARERFTQAIDREDRNWQLFYLRSKVEHEAGRDGAARADLDRARQLNPKEDCLDEGWDCG